MLSDVNGELDGEVSLSPQCQGAEGGSPRARWGSGETLGGWGGPGAGLAEEKGRQSERGAGQLNKEKGQTSSNGKGK